MKPINRRWPVYTNPVTRQNALLEARHALRDAQELVRMAQAPYTLLKIKAARRSLEGAIRHADGRTYRNPGIPARKVSRPRRLA